MIFLTVGTYPLPFNRLLKIVDECISKGLISDSVFAQIGACTYKPCNMRYIDLLEKRAFDKYMRDASYIIGHAGMGTITMALEHNKPLLVLPRRRQYKEHVNDHQVSTARKFEQLGHVVAAVCECDFQDKYEQLSTFIPKKRVCQTRDVAERIACFLQEVDL